MSRTIIKETIRTSFSYGSEARDIRTRFIKGNSPARLIWTGLYFLIQTPVLIRSILPIPNRRDLIWYINYAYLIY